MGIESRIDRTDMMIIKRSNIQDKQTNRAVDIRLIDFDKDNTC